jgi:hypothetical protein
MQNPTKIKITTGINRKKSKNAKPLKKQAETIMFEALFLMESDSYITFSSTIPLNLSRRKNGYIAPDMIKKNTEKRPEDCAR